MVAFVNRADCFLTIHRKVQAPDPSIKKMSEVHVRKVQVETEDLLRHRSPYRLVMNLGHTGFNKYMTTSRCSNRLKYKNLRRVT